MKSELATRLLKPNNITSPFKSDQRWQIVKITEYRKKEYTKRFKEISALNILLENKIREETIRALKSLQKVTYIKKFKIKSEHELHS